MKKFFWGLGIIILFACLTVFYIFTKKYLNVSVLLERKKSFAQVVDNNYWLSVLTYLSIGISVIVLCIPITSFWALVGGFAFGIVPGLLFAICFIFCASILSFVISRKFLKRMVEARYENQVALFNSLIEKYGILQSRAV